MREESHFLGSPIWCLNPELGDVHREGEELKRTGSKTEI